MREWLGWVLCLVIVVIAFFIEDVLHWPVGIGMGCATCYIIGQNVRRPTPPEPRPKITWGGDL